MKTFVENQIKKSYEVKKNILENKEIFSEMDKVIAKIKSHIKKSPSGDLGAYEDVKGFCKSSTIEEVAVLDYVLTPGRYVGLPDDDDDFDFNERFSKLTAELKEEMLEEERLNSLILENLSKVIIL